MINKLREAEGSTVPECNQCYPEVLLSEIISAAQKGIEGTGIVAAKQESLTPVVSLFSAAW